MHLPIKLSLIAALAVAMASCDSQADQGQNKTEAPTTEQAATETVRIVSLNGAISEVLVELGMESQIVGTDVTSTYPESVAKLPKVGHNRNISPEGVISLNPDLVLGVKSELKPELAQQLSAGGAEVKLVEQEYSVEGTKNLIREVAQIVGKTEEANEVIQRMEDSLKAVQPLENAPKVLFIYARGAGTLMVAGDGTQMQSVIELAGGQNAVSGFENFRPLTPESLLEANPDVILMFSSGVESLEGYEGLLQVPGVAETNAGKNKAFIAMDGQFLAGFGPRLGQAVAQLNKQLKAYAQVEAS